MSIIDSARSTINSARSTINQINPIGHKIYSMFVAGLIATALISCQEEKKYSYTDLNQVIGGMVGLNKEYENLEDTLRIQNGIVDSLRSANRNPNIPFNTEMDNVFKINNHNDTIVDIISRQNEIAKEYNLQREKLNNILKNLPSTSGPSNTINLPPNILIKTI